MSNIPLDSSGYIVMFKPTASNINTLINNISRTNRIPIANRYSKVFKGFCANFPNDVYNRISRMNQVQSIHPNVRVKACSQTTPWSLSRVGADSNIYSSMAYDNPQATPFSNVHVFVLDTGVSVKHPDINVVESLSFVENEIGLTDLNGHGTAVATTIAAKNNDVYTLGICPGAQVHSYKVLGEDGTGYFSYSMAAIDKIIEFREKNSNVPMVVNMSLGGFVGSPDYTAIDYAISNIVCNYRVPVVVAAGNETDDASLYSPAHCEEAITVGSYGQNNELSWFSNFGHVVDLLAPGESLAVAYKKFSQEYMNGTSFAAPIVSGSVGTYLMDSPDATPAQIKESLVQNGMIATDCNLNAPITHNYSDTTQTSVYIGDQMYFAYM